MKMLRLMFLLVLTLSTAAKAQVTLAYVDTMAFTQESLDRMDQEIWQVYYNREFERTLPIFKAMWEKGEREYAETQDSIAYRFLNYGKATYAQWLTLLGHFDEGLPLFEEALTDTEAFFGPIKRLGYAYVGLGGAYAQFGDPYRALWAQNQAARIVDLHIKPGDPDYYLAGNKFLNLASVYSDLKQPEKAIRLLEEAEKVYRTGNANDWIITTLERRARIAASHGNTDLARVYLRRAQTIVDGLDSVEGDTKVFLYAASAFVEQKTGNVKQAIADYEAAERIIEKYTGSNTGFAGIWPNIVAVLRLNYAELLLDSGDAKRAKEIIAAGKTIHRTATQDENNTEALRFRLLEARLAGARQNWPAAARQLETTIGILTNQKEVNRLVPEVDSALVVPSPLLAEAFRISAEIQSAAGTYSLDPILANCEAGKAILRKIQLSYAPDVTMDRLIRENQALYDLSIEKSYARAVSAGDAESLAAYFSAIEEAHDQQLLAAIDTREEVAYGLPANLMEAEAKARRSLRSYERLLHAEQAKSPRNRELIEAYSTQLRTSRFLIDSLAAVIRKDFPEYYELKFRDQPVSLHEVRQTLGSDEAMFCYYQTKARSYGLMITASETVPFVAELNTDQVNDFSATLLEPTAKPTEAWCQRSLALYEQLLGPAKGRDLSSLIIVADKTLNLLAWPALLTENTPSVTGWKQLPYLVRAYDLRQEASAGIYLKSRTASAAKYAVDYAGFAPAYEGDVYSMRGDSNISSTALLFPEFTRQGLGELKYNGDEVRFATSLFGQSVSEVGAGATEAFFKEVAGTSAILHVATHGITSAHDPAASHLLFQQEEQEGTEDGQLHAWEIYGMNIPADLTVLSACQTGTGALRTGTGVLSLARAFRYAGSKDVVMSLWSVNDRSTYQLMRHFFTEVQQEQGKAKALQNAMVRHLESEKDAALMHPYYWAGFSLVGPGELLNTGRNLSWWVLVGVITLVLGTGVLLRFKK